MVVARYASRRKVSNRLDALDILEHEPKDFRSAKIGAVRKRFGEPGQIGGRCFILGVP